MATTTDGVDALQRDEQKVFSRGVVLLTIGFDYNYDLLTLVQIHRLIICYPKPVSSGEVTVDYESVA